ncbi:MAG: site-2 protease family protein [Parcubacteria group bacterium]|nr:site-2 protease family protein [Parcubacteria group bacterium]
MADLFDTIRIFIIQIVFLIFSVMVHEVFHGLSAHWMGDETAKMEGRLTLNPLKHLDPFGSIILPLILGLAALFGAGGIIFGWAKPVPYNPNNLKYKKYGPSLVALAGPMANFLIAVSAGLLIRFFLSSNFSPAYFNFLSDFVSIIAFVVFINLLLGIFNLLPIPPLDGSKLLFAVLPSKFDELKISLEQYGFIILLLFLFIGFQIIIPPILFLFRIITGQPFI